MKSPTRTSWEPAREGYDCRSGAGAGWMTCAARAVCSSAAQDCLDDILTITRPSTSSWKRMPTPVLLVLLVSSPLNTSFVDSRPGFMPDCDRFKCAVSKGCRGRAGAEGAEGRACGRGSVLDCLEQVMQPRRIDCTRGIDSANTNSCRCCSLAPPHRCRLRHRCCLLPPPLPLLPVIFTTSGIRDDLYILKIEWPPNACTRLIFSIFITNSQHKWQKNKVGHS